MKFVVQLIQSEEGYAVGVPALPGCHSQGDTRDEALANIVDAIQLYLYDDHDYEGASFETAVVDVDLSHAKTGGR